MEVGCGELLLLLSGGMFILCCGQKKRLTQLFAILLFVALGAGGQIYGYAFIHQRYMLPCLVFYAIGICELLQMLKWDDIGVLLRYPRFRWYMGCVTIGLLLVCVLMGLTWNMAVANGKALHEFLPLPLFGVCLGLVVLAFFCGMMFVKKGRISLAIAYCFLFLFIFVRGSWVYSYGQVGDFVRSTREWDTLICTIQQQKPRRVLLVSDVKDGIGWEAMSFMHAQLSYHDKIETHWVIWGMPSEKIESMKTGWSSNCYHEGTYLTKDLFSLETLPGGYDAAFVLDRMKSNLVPQTMEHFGFSNQKTFDLAGAMIALWK